MSMKFNDSNFDAEVLQSKDPVLVDFYADWCGPCQMQGPIIDQLADLMKDKAVKIGKVNVDESNETASKYEVMSIPTLIIFKDGQVVDKMMGMQNLDVLKEKLDNLV